MTDCIALHPCRYWHDPADSSSKPEEGDESVAQRTWDMDSLGVDPAPVSAKGETAALPPAPPPPKELLRVGAGAFQMLPPTKAPDVGGPLRIRSRWKRSVVEAVAGGRRSRVDRVSRRGCPATKRREAVTHCGRAHQTDDAAALLPLPSPPKP